MLRILNRAHNLEFFNDFGSITVDRFLLSTRGLRQLRGFGVAATSYRVLNRDTEHRERPSRGNMKRIPQFTIPIVSARRGRIADQHCSEESDEHPSQYTSRDDGG